MKNFNKKFSEIEPVGMSIAPFLSILNRGKKVGLILSAILIMVGTSCKKVQEVTPTESYYGYGKIIVTCESKCHVTFGTGEKLNDYDIDASTATYTFRYQTKYSLDITITPTDKDQRVEMSVYSREEKQIFRNSAVRKVNVPWNSVILVP
ncbi:hypothetical protein SNE25_24220 [Mucilaginibacter sabulilitoris]|uniref:Lipoprotein n=1 Tax=Mucilaginibacter sabulilitoris TaxID=1173583 RepID=A0ABZ0TJ47_9SPHI|nr:hypothetical protein [Mucilaginibacter sabulilitoris]WPU92437.1 hypothetical protein SNE25_24220 [Mucilaginibacter sabulilitoris]